MSGYAQHFELNLQKLRLDRLGLSHRATRNFYDSRFFMTQLTDRISIRVTANQKQNLQKFCLENGVQQKKFVLRAIDHALKNLQN